MEIDKCLSIYKTTKGEQYTHTKIGDNKLNIYGGTYCIPNENVNEFYNVYKDYVLRQNKESYLTEKQLENGPILIDFDFRYDPSIETKQHNIDDIITMIENIFECIKKIKNTTSEIFKCHVFEKSDVNTSSEDITKDGIHIIIDIQMDFTEKILLRNEMLKQMIDIFNELPLINNIEQVIDEGVMKGNVNWQLFGSKKPGNDAYELKYLFYVHYDEEINIEQKVISKDYIFNHFNLLTARNNILKILDINPSMNDTYEKMKLQRNKVRKCKVKTISTINYDKNFSQISNEAELDGLIDYYISDCNFREHKIKETHDYSLLLDDSFYEKGSYNKWIRLGMALKNTHNNLFLTWLKVSCKSISFDWNDVETMYDLWNNFYNDNGLTEKSVIYWCKDSNPKEFYNIHKNTIQKYIHYSLYNNEDHNIATLLYQGYKDSYVCVSYKSNIWYEFKNNIWQEIDTAINLRKKISNELFNEYDEYSNNLLNNEIDDEKKKDIKSRIVKISKILKTSNNKNSIMKEASEIFYDDKFYNKLNKNPYLIGCKNCIIDIKNKEHRKGIHEDYVSLTTNNNYYPLDYYMKRSPEIIDELNEFMNQLFPDKELCEYMWEHLASTLLGTTDNQTFNIYIGSGANGKSVLVELMEKVLGDYKGSVPSSLITQKRNNIGATSPEVHQLIGKRYAVMSELEKNEKINEGVMKEITGGDPIQCRALFKDSITFTPQFKLVVMTNVLFDVKSNDDGTWRRIRVCEFKSKFTDKPYNDPKFPKKDYPFQYKLDTELKNTKFEKWVPVFLSMLVNIAYKTQGKVKDRACVLEPTNKYREGQDIFLEFCNTHINEESSEMGLKISFITEIFRAWHLNEFGNQKASPRPKELREYLEKKYGHYPTTGWSNISIKEEFL